MYCLEPHRAIVCHVMPCLSLYAMPFLWKISGHCSGIARVLFRDDKGGGSLIVLRANLLHALWVGRWKGGRGGS